MTHRTSHRRSHREAPARRGVAAGFDFGFELPPMTPAQIAALPEPEWAVPAARTGLPRSLELRRIDLDAVGGSLTDFDENLAHVAAMLKQYPQLVRVPAVRMQLARVGLAFAKCGTAVAL